MKVMLNLYGPIIALAVLAGTGWTAREFKTAGLDPNKVWEALPWVLVFGVVGARLYHVVHLWSYYSADLVRVLAVWNGGLGIYGGLVGGAAGLGVYLVFADLKSQISKVPLFNWLNLLAPGVALGQAIGRVGNILNHELLPFAVYEMVWDLAIFVVLVNCKICGLFVKEIRGVSSTFVLYLFLYAFGRFFLEFLRTDNVWRVGVLTVAQLISLLIVFTAFLLIRKSVKENDRRREISAVE